MDLPSLDDGAPFWIMIIGLVFLAIYVVSFISFLILFPFYLCVNRVNRRRDQRNVLFPTINHFFKMIQVVYTLFVTTLIIVCIGFSFGFSLNYSTQSSRSTFLMMFVLSIWWLLSIIIQVFYILIILLAIEKFAIYFFPSTEKFVISAQKYQIKYVRSFYLVIAIFQFLLTINTLKLGLRTFDGIRIRMITYICFNIIFMLSALLYVPIMISVGKFSYLISAQRNNPQKYIFWQTFNILIFKLTFIAAIAYCLVALASFEDLVLSQMFGDIIIIPQVIQISYLSCNKRNMDTLLKSFSGIKFVRLAFNIRETTSVAPLCYSLLTFF